MKKTLRQLVNEVDRDRARTHALSGEPVLAARPSGSTRRVCGSCWHVVDDWAEYRRWEAETRVACGCLDEHDNSWRGSPRGWSHWFSGEHRWIIHQWFGVTSCPKCGGPLAEVTP